MSLNKVMLIGNVGKDPDVRYLDNNQTTSSTKVASFPLATSERYKDKSGAVHDNTEWHNIVVWRGLADVVEKYVKKGIQLFIEGRLRTRMWTDQSGSKHYTTEIIADNMQILTKKNENNNDLERSNSAYQNPQSKQNSEFEKEVNSDDDLPF